MKKAMHLAALGWERENLTPDLIRATECPGSVLVLVAVSTRTSFLSVSSNVTNSKCAWLVKGDRRPSLPCPVHVHVRVLPSMSSPANRRGAQSSVLGTGQDALLLLTEESCDAAMHVSCASKHAYGSSSARKSQLYNCIYIPISIYLYTYMSGKKGNWAGGLEDTGGGNCIL